MQMYMVYQNTSDHIIAEIRKCGGVSVFMKEDSKFIVRDYLQTNVHIECVFIEHKKEEHWDWDQMQ